MKQRIEQLTILMFFLLYIMNLSTKLMFLYLKDDETNDFIDVLVYTKNQTNTYSLVCNTKLY